MGEKDLKNLKTGFPEKRKYLTIKLAYPYKFFNSIDEYQKSVINLNNDDFLRKLKNKCPNHREIERTKGINKKINIKNGEELTELCCKSDILLLACVFEKFVKASVIEFGFIPLCCVSLPGYTWQCGSKNTGVVLQTLQVKI